MRFPHWLAAGLFAFTLTPPVAAEQLLQSHALLPCSNDGIISVNHFDIVFTPSNNSALVSFDGQADYAGNVYIDIALYAYGYKAATKIVNPCALNVDALCPLRRDTALKITNVPLNLDGVDLSIIPGEFGHPVFYSVRSACNFKFFWSFQILFLLFFFSPSPLVCLRPGLGVPSV